MTSTRSGARGGSTPPRDDTLAETQATFTIVITDAQIERAIARATTTFHYDSDDEEEEHPMDLRAFVKERLAAKVDAVVAEVTKQTVETVVAERVRKALDEGFQVYNEWGAPAGRKTLTDLVGEHIFKTRDSYNVSRIITEHAKQEATKQVAAAVKQAADSIDKVFADAAAEGIASLLKRKLVVV